MGVGRLPEGTIDWDEVSELLCCDPPGRTSMETCQNHVIGHILWGKLYNLCRVFIKSIRISMSTIMDMLGDFTQVIVLQNKTGKVDYVNKWVRLCETVSTSDYLIVLLPFQLRLSTYYWYSFQNVALR